MPNQYPAIEQDLAHLHPVQADLIRQVHIYFVERSGLEKGNLRKFDSDFLQRLSDFINKLNGWNEDHQQFNRRGQSKNYYQLMEKVAALPKQERDDWLEAYKTFLTAQTNRAEVHTTHTLSRLMACLTIKNNQEILIQNLLVGLHKMFDKAPDSFILILKAFGKINPELSALIIYLLMGANREGTYLQLSPDNTEYRQRVVDVLTELCAQPYANMAKVCWFMKRFFFYFASEKSAKSVKDHTYNLSLQALFLAIAERDKAKAMDLLSYKIDFTECYKGDDYTHQLVRSDYYGDVTANLLQLFGEYAKLGVKQWRMVVTEIFYRNPGLYDRDLLTLIFSKKSPDLHSTLILFLNELFKGLTHKRRASVAQYLLCLKSGDGDNAVNQAIKHANATTVLEFFKLIESLVDNNDTLFGRTILPYVFEENAHRLADEVCLLILNMLENQLLDIATDDKEKIKNLLVVLQGFLAGVNVTTSHPDVHNKAFDLMARFIMKKLSDDNYALSAAQVFNTLLYSLDHSINDEIRIFRKHNYLDRIIERQDFQCAYKLISVVITSVFQNLDDRFLYKYVDTLHKKLLKWKAVIAQRKDLHDQDNQLLQDLIDEVHARCLIFKAHHYLMVRAHDGIDADFGERLLDFYRQINQWQGTVQSQMKKLFHRHEYADLVTALNQLSPAKRQEILMLYQDFLAKHVRIKLKLGPQETIVIATMSYAFLRKAHFEEIGYQRMTLFSGSTEQKLYGDSEAMTEHSDALKKAYDALLSADETHDDTVQFLSVVHNVLPAANEAFKTTEAFSEPDKNEFFQL